MLITEKRLRQIVSSELRRMFLSEALNINDLPDGPYKEAAAYLDPIMRKDSNIYTKFEELASSGSRSLSATLVRNQTTNRDAKTNKNRFIFSLVALATGKAPNTNDVNAGAAGKVPPSLGINQAKFDEILSGVGDFTEAVRHLGNLAVNDPAEVATQALAGEKKGKTGLEWSPGNPKPVGIDYTIVKGDTLSALLNKYYGIPLSAKSYDLYDLTVSKGMFNPATGLPPNADTIKPGMKMVLPDDVYYNGKLFKRKSATNTPVASAGPQRSASPA